jgi:hypothetical protein
MAQGDHGLESLIPEFIWEATERKLGMGTYHNPGPGQILNEWRRAYGPEERRLDARMFFTQWFIQSPNVKEVMLKAMKFMRAENQGRLPANGRKFTGFKGTFGISAFFGLHTTDVAHVIGSFKMDVQPVNGELLFRAENKMSINSFNAGNWLDKVRNITGGGPFGVRERFRPEFYGNTYQTISWKRENYDR